jgi:hypothetical protein
VESIVEKSKSMCVCQGPGEEHEHDLYWGVAFVEIRETDRLVSHNRPILSVQDLWSLYGVDE